MSFTTPSSKTNTNSKDPRQQKFSIDESANEKVRRDLLSLGIDLDEGLIERMRRNLGVNSSFDAFARTSNIMKSRVVRQEGHAPDISFRSVETDKDVDKSSTRKSHSNIALLQGDHARANMLLRELLNKQNALPPTVRAIAQHLLHKLGILYGRHPDLFLRRLLNVPKRKAVETHALLLKSRYLDEKPFVAALRRLVLDLSAHDASEFFAFLEEPKLFSGNLISVVDLWTFVLLLQSGDQSRRTFEQSSSQTAVDVEFWNQKRAAVPSGMTDHPVRCVSSTGRFSSKGRVSSPASWNTAAEAFNSDYCRAVDKSIVKFSDKLTNENVAQLLGRDLHQHRGVTAKGRQTFGAFTREIKQDATQVSEALHSPTREPVHEPRRLHEQYKSWSEYVVSTDGLEDMNVSKDDLTYANKQRLLEGSAVAAALGRPHSAPRLRSHGRIAATLESTSTADVASVASSKTSSRPRPTSSFNALRRDYSSNSNVADALGTPSRKEILATSMKSPRKSSVGTMAAENKCKGIKNLLSFNVTKPGVH